MKHNIPLKIVLILSNLTLNGGGLDTNYSMHPDKSHISRILSSSVSFILCSK